MADMDGIAKYLLETGNLKRVKRTGWWFAQIKDPESVAEHSHRAAVVGMILAALEGADPNRTALLAVLHDSPETRIGDIPHIGRRYLTAVPAEDVVADQVEDMPGPVAALIANAVAEFEDGDSPEARCAKDADKLECLIQAVEYRHGGAGVEEWIDSSMNALKTESARAIAEAVLAADPLAWQQPRR
ncbi:HD domain-containing protein [Glycomyces tritici]|uniref:5'-deoxynucleotidase n=1 Tax=Glycomyces tritici TaxID=2665176 RepID=A0ABT7YYU9_9ACTN|nr:HD domain-containing protein [Glycomyces tritici]MDN3243836.1 HD domain-containing protein [Glycomyces tritici]